MLFAQASFDTMSRFTKRLEKVPKNDFIITTAKRDKLKFFFKIIK